MRWILMKSHSPTILELGSLNETVTLHINCPGGNVIESLAMYDFIQNFPLPVVGIVEGAASSGGSILLFSRKKDKFLQFKANNIYVRIIFFGR